MPVSDEVISSVLRSVVPRIASHRQKLLHNDERRHPPFVLALTGLQGSGKSTWASKIYQALKKEYNFKVIALSLDDLYLDHQGLVRTRESNPNNPLLRTRGQPGTHDDKLARSFFESLASGQGDILVPAFDKSKFDGEGDRVPRDQWECVGGESLVDVVVFEGWCVGFQPLPGDDLEKKWKAAKQARSVEKPENAEEDYSTTTLGGHALENLKRINANLQRYCETYMGPQHLDFLVHIDTNDLKNVYRWRIQQEHALWNAKGEGMTDAAVVAFVQGYMPSYELYLDQLREGFFRDCAGTDKAQLRILMEEDRSVVEIKEIDNGR
ncbi:hypothetical protein W97_06419 [Coniosporium apollinis CBS 100218]|uniref:D-glycerate 3-kinase n=1 Tax=Coniosporium apollinis (strain CBS 100218) TaxID=1168221 RepID=R7YZU5_CONA1|nr:uncharacterized protein W97_06419 [Coniosporium apollinis CBS 100218]EON67166.1 hypothetical protein W97_06419 [Coniosporium apollinis CBS 100218]